VTELRGVRVLVVEDEGLVAMLIEDLLEDLGCTVAGSAATLAEAMELVQRGGFDFALLDVNLAGEKVAIVAEALDRRDVPFAFASGYGRTGLPVGFQNRPILQKPFHQRQLAAIIRAALPEQSIQRTDTPGSTPSP
jgi:CheY-like chemotaxis protein